MSMIRQVIIYGVILLGGLWNIQAQDVTFSQFYAAPLHLNPAFAGVTLGPRISLNYRDQWPSWPNAYRTFAATYEQPLEDLNSGLGVILMADDAGNGIYKTISASGVYSYQLRIRDNLRIKIGVQAGIIQNRLDWDQLIFVDQLDPLSGANGPDGSPIISDEQRPDRLNRTNLDFSTGLLIYGGQFYGGISIKHLNRPDDSFLSVNNNLGIGLPARFSVHAGTQIYINRGNNRSAPTFISPNILFEQQAGFGQLNAGAYASYGQVFGGLWYRHTFENPDAIIGLMGVRYGVLKIGYSYDLTMSDLSASRPGGTHEISVIINLEDSRRLRRKSSSDLNDCFKMFN
jgi:type IX secretion system PorP/SprF family membrane protein